MPLGVQSFFFFLNQTQDINPQIYVTDMLLAEKVKPKGPNIFTQFKIGSYPKLT